MQIPPKTAMSKHRGMSFMELTIVIGALMGLTALLFIGVRAWRTGTDRANCIMNQRTMQLAVRSLQNLYGYRNGSEPNGQSVAEALLAREFIGEELYQCATGTRTCPARGDYIVDHPDRFPDDGELFMTCSLADSRQHEAEGTTDW